jgi:hypothetical protein
MVNKQVLLEAGQVVALTDIFTFSCHLIASSASLQSPNL